MLTNLLYLGCITHLPYVCMYVCMYVASYPAFPIPRFLSLAPIFHTASDKNLGIGKAGYEANMYVCMYMYVCLLVVAKQHLTLGSTVIIFLSLLFLNSRPLTLSAITCMYVCMFVCMFVCCLLPSNRQH